jgi:hypothetical protein
MTEIYVMSLNYYYDDYKRPEGSSEIIGIKKNLVDAYKTVFKLEFEKNLEWYETFMDERLSKITPVPENKYRIMYKKLNELIEITDEFISEWDDARCDALGESEFGINPSGYTAGVSKFILE